MRRSRSILALVIAAALACAGGAAAQDDKKEAPRSEAASTPEAEGNPSPEGDPSPESNRAPERAGSESTESVPTHVLVADGIRLFEKGEIDAAQDKFAAAEVAAPEDHRVAFNRGRAYQAQGNAEQAKTYYTKALRSSTPSLSGRASFNLGTLAVARARALLGDDPVAVKKEDRETVLEHLDDAVRHFRAVLTNVPADKDARHNIELIRVWAKDMTDRWRRADRDAAREQLPLLQYLAYLIDEQKRLETATGFLAGGRDEDGKPVRLEEIVITQGELGEEIDPLKSKVRAHVAQLREAVMQQVAASQGASPSPGASAPSVPQPGLQPSVPGGASPSLKLPDAVEERIASLETSLIDHASGAGDEIATALSAIDAIELDKAKASQRAARRHFDAMWKTIAPFLPLLDRAIEDQSRAIDQTEPHGGGVLGFLGAVFGKGTKGAKGAKGRKSGDDKAGDETSAQAKAKRSKRKGPSAEELATLRTVQADVAALLPNLTEKAMAAQQQWTARAAQAASTPPPQPGQPGQATPQGPSPEEMKKAFDEAVKLLPDARAAVDEAVDALNKPAFRPALVAERKAKKVLEKIRELFKQKDQKKDDDKKKDQDKKDDQKKKDQEQDQKDQKKDKQDEKQKDGEDGKKPREVELDPEEARRLLEKMRESRNKREKKRKAEIAGRRIRVERDW